MLINIIVHGQDLNKLMTGEKVKPSSAAALTGNLNVCYQLVTLDTLEYDFEFGLSGGLISVQRRPNCKVKGAFSVESLYMLRTAAARRRDHYKHTGKSPKRQESYNDLVEELSIMIREAEKDGHKQN